ncbi:MAG: copper amine oxidase N-terminal domain-containing protein, partial [Firmicutes bacterium]|nr:copper amine oxidase N-terminal domain-containing protein [Bacillota bacterium]
YTDTGSFQLNLAQLPTTKMAVGDGAFDQSVLMRALNQNRIDYTGKVDVNNKVMQYDLTIVDTASNAKSALLSLVLKDELFYIKIDDLFKYLGQYCSTAEKQQLDQTLGDIVWVSLSKQELNAMMPEGSQPIFSGDLFQSSSTQQTVWKRLLDGLFNDAYKGYQSGLVTQNNNQYTLTLRGAELMNIIKPAAIYSINHIDEVGRVLRTFLNGLKAEEMASLGLNTAMRAELVQGVDMMVQEVNQNRPKYLSEMENMSPATSQEMQQTLNDTQLVNSVAKPDNNTYKQGNLLHVHISAGNPTETVDFTLNQQNTIKTGGTVQVGYPVGQVITFTEMEKRMPAQMNVNVDTGVYSSNRGFLSSSGTLEVHLVDGYTYLPLRLVGESLGEKVAWDQAAYQPYVLQGGQRIYMTGLEFNNRAFIKLRDFERLGYTVSWNELTRTAAITK